MQIAPLIYTVIYSYVTPANDQIRAERKRVHKGDIVELSGYLVNIQATDGWRWHSSLTRGDTVNGACELIWVEDFQIVTDMYL
ncbi:hypothetical protein [Oceanobacter mangrovi]|uniref:hypothetical protein n=1 Tax=Oceanobacter mangrovi TaxID=2862510 RepID=UPI001C8EB891|nr:hypothetical protein [Oceanobacter mangrovi]